MRKIKIANIKSMYYLEPEVGGQKSFYGKASVVETPSAYILKSYNTFVCAIIKNRKKVYRLWDGYSSTTMRHVNSFVRRFRGDNGGKSYWNTLEFAAIE